ncbi:SCO2584 family spore wall biosynthesis protein [Streptomyces xanthophaeus]|uniref:SCO2584 family spore wall biosynthesis protein n=1 Tax=Streptomyces xanthophaeus TaxID=67385 RepID=UPI00364C0D6A
MPDDVGGKPFPDDGDPENDRDDRGGADHDFASVVFDEAFVRNAQIHELSAAERQRAADRAHAEAEAARAAFAGGWPGDEDHDGHGYGHTDGYGPDDHGWEYERGYGQGYPDGPYGAYGGRLRPYRGRSPWLRPVAWVLAFVMGLGMVALAFSAVYRSASGEADPAPAPASTPLGEVTGVGAFTYPVGRQP